MSEQPQFDDTRRALSFALNAHRSAAPPRPAASVAMANGVAKPKRKRVSKKAAAAAEEERLAREDEERRAMVRAAFGGPRSPKREERDRAAQAGLILAVLDRMDAAHAAVLRARLIVSHEACSCRRPCCSGWAVNLRWVVAVSAICDMLRDSADLLKVKGKRGMSTLPQLRRIVVEHHFTERPQTLGALAERAGVSSITAAKHRAAILEWLEATENEAWAQAQLMLDRAGVTGAFTE